MTGMEAFYTLAESAGILDEFHFSDPRKNIAVGEEMMRRGLEREEAADALARDLRHRGFNVYSPQRQAAIRSREQANKTVERGDRLANGNSTINAAKLADLRKQQRADWAAFNASRK